MVPDIAGNGASFRGAGTYYLHDKPFTREDGTRVDPTTDARVAWTEIRNCVATDAQAALDEMWRTAEAQDAIKALAGVKLTGRKCTEPVKTLSLAWHPDEMPSKERMIEAADSFLEHMGWSAHQAVYVAHNDTAHAHVHIILNRVNPDTGRTLDDFREQIRSQVWALAYEREHGRIYCEERLNKDYAGSHMAKRDDQFPNGIEQDGRRQEAPFVAATATLDRLDGTERDLLHDRQREEREAFFASAKSEFRAVRQQAFVDVRRDFRRQWKEHYADARMLMNQARELQQDDGARALQLARDGKFGEAWQQIAGGERPETFDPITLAKMSIAASKEKIAEEMKGERIEQQQAACEALHAERAERYLEMKERQRDERAELRAMDAAATRGEAIDRDRLTALLHGDRAPKPAATVDPSTLLAALRRANDNALSIDTPHEANDNRPPQLSERNADVARANHHIDLLLASARMTSSGSMVSMQMADLKRLQKQDQRARRDSRDDEMTDRLQRLMSLDERTGEEKQRDRLRSEPPGRDRGGGRDA